MKWSELPAEQKSQRTMLIFVNIIGGPQFEFRQNRSTINHIFCICHMLEKKWE